MFRSFRKFIVIEALSLIAGAGAACAAPGDIDSSFGSGGVVKFTGDLVPMPDGRIAAVGADETGLEIRMLTVDGEILPSWGTDGVARVALADTHEWFNTTPVAVGADGSLVLYGGIRNFGSESKTVPAVLKLDASGQPDAAFGPDGRGIVVIENPPDSVTTISGVALQPDGSVLVGGTDVGEYWCGNAGAVLRLSPNGSPDAGFGKNGWVEIADTGETCLVGLAGIRGDGSMVVTNGSNRFWSLRSDGTPDTGFGTDGRLSDPLPDITGYVLLPDGGLLLVGGVDDQSHTRLARFDAAGQPVAGFGNGGVLAIDFGDLAFGNSDIGEAPSPLILGPDGQSALLKVIMYPRHGGSADFCTAVTLLRLDGTLDPSFGQGGLSCLRGIWPIGLSLAVQSDGRPLLTASGSGTIRLLRDDRPSPGLIGVSPDTVYVREDAGKVTVTVSRSAGKDGAVSIDYRTFASTDYRTTANTATEGSDFTAASGRLEWADGEDGDRSITLTIIDDAEHEPPKPVNGGDEAFDVELSVAGGDALLLATMPARVARVVIQDNDPAPQAPAAQRAASGGGGSTSWLVLIALLALLLPRAASSARPFLGHAPVRDRARGLARSADLNARPDAAG